MADPKERNLEWLRRQFIIALAADDELYELLILKGGNALALAHEIGMRTSLDIDYSLAEEAPDDEALGRRLEVALTKWLVRSGLTVFDWKFGPRPRRPRDEQSRLWGGYRAEFKVIETELWDEGGRSLEQARNRAWGITPGGNALRKFRLEFSRNEVCEGAGEIRMGEGFTVRVYTPAMIAVEKLRALCQQMKEYGHSEKRKPRGRDFYDIHAVVTEGGTNLGSVANRELMRTVFAAKDVPLGLLGLIEKEISFHEGEWDDVRNSIPAGRPVDFGFYTDFVMGEVRKLEALWKEDTP